MTQYPNDQSMAAGATPVWIAARSITPTPPTPVPTTIAGSGTYSTGALPLAGRGAIAASVELSQAGVLTIQRYIDEAASIPIGDPLSQVLTTNAVGTAAMVADGVPFATYTVSVTNSSGSVANLTNFNILQA